MAFKAYLNLEGSSGVTAFEEGNDEIKVVFENTVYVYTYSITGKEHVEKMKKLAQQGKGLSTYISRHVREKYLEKYHFKNKDHDN